MEDLNNIINSPLSTVNRWNRLKKNYMKYIKAMKKKYGKNGELFAKMQFNISAKNIIPVLIQDLNQINEQINTNEVTK